MDTNRLLKQILSGLHKFNDEELAEVYLHTQKTYSEREFENEATKNPKVIETIDLKPLVEEMRRKRQEGLLEGISTGYPTLDKRTGGWRGNELITIVGGSGVGKTRFAMNVVQNMAIKGIPIAFVSLELSNAQITDRLETMCQSTYMQDQNGAQPDAYSLPFHLMPSEYRTPGLMKSWVYHVVQNLGVKVIVFDHLSYMPPLADEDLDNQKLWCMQLRNWVTELDVTAVLLHHFNKGGATRKKAGQGSGDISGSQKIHDLSDQVYLLHRKIHDPKDWKFVTCLVDKVRNGGKLGTEVFEQDEWHKLLPADSRQAEKIISKSEAEDVFGAIREG